MRLLVIGGGSRLGQAIGRAHPGATKMLRGAFDDADATIVPDYLAATANHMAGYDAVINCTGLVNGTSKALHLANASLPAHLAQCAAAANVQHFIHVSSFSVYGPVGQIDHGTPVCPHTPYGKSKTAGEQILLSGAERSRVTVVRLPMLYGDGASKLSRLILAWRRMGWWVVPQNDIARAMMHYDLAAMSIVKLASARPRGVVAAADVEAFSYHLAQTALQTGDARARALTIPTGMQAILNAVGGEKAKALFTSSNLARSSNIAATIGLPSRLRADIEAMARS